MLRGKMDRSRTAKFAAAFFTAEIRAWHGEEPLWKVLWVYGVATSVVIVEVVRRTEPDMALVPCFAPVDASCTIFSSCALRGALSEARDAFLTALDGHTLLDLVRPRASLRKLLSFNPNGRTAAAQTSRSIRRA
jgi:hypothetical protein